MGVIQLVSMGFIAVARWVVVDILLFPKKPPRVMTCFTTVAATQYYFGSNAGPPVAMDLHLTRKIVITQKPPANISSCRESRKKGFKIMQFHFKVGIVFASIRKDLRFKQFQHLQ